MTQSNENSLIHSTEPAESNPHSTVLINTNKIGLVRAIDKHTGEAQKNVDYYINFKPGKVCGGRTDQFGFTQLIRFTGKIPTVSFNFISPKKEVSLGDEVMSSDNDLKNNNFNSELTVVSVSQLDKKDYKITPVQLDNRAAVRQAIISGLRKSGCVFKTRSAWKANDSQKVSPDWNYTKIAIHNAGNSYSCSDLNGDKIKKIEEEHMGKFNQFGYHYAVGCDGEIFEGQDIRNKGAHISFGNTSIIGIVLMSDLDEQWWDSDDKVTSLQEKAVKKIISTLLNYFNITELGGHKEHQVFYRNPKKPNEVIERSCPGNLGMEFVKKLREEFKLGKPTKYTQS
ncbi:peptidoglycan recognition protein family protein [Cronobacter turicensis]|nr:N-acetylmuramoyl-L-alanine amidase [Cronobacter turicensis]ELY4131356.1 N-acetylmuramoyl-L-alanine amidase [Cronobacter turicensis]ELY4351618.1 N-acetylmuramoyl-L-alanine amidase [Cronobacter turicensis]ELY6279475.1 N-acetylmuramoyl-L-alanine amidase [Cronobacter turicensis]